jgi:hypothetical protein
MPIRVWKCSNAQDTTLKIQEESSWGRRRSFAIQRGEACNERGNHADSEDPEGEGQSDFGARCGIPREVTVCLSVVMVRVRSVERFCRVVVVVVTGRALGVAVAVRRIHMWEEHKGRVSAPTMINEDVHSGEQKSKRNTQTHETHST